MYIIADRYNFRVENDAIGFLLKRIFYDKCDVITEDYKK